MKRSLVISVNSSIRILTLCVALLLTVSQVFGQATVTATGAGPGPTAYPTLQAAFAQINAGTHTGAITVTIGAGGTVETGTAILNANAAPANYTSVIVKPAVGTTPLITSAFNGAVIHLFGATNVTIDGSNTAGGTTRDLTIRSTFATVATALTAGIRLGSAAVGASDITIANCVIQCAGTGLGMCITSGSGVTMYGSGTLPHNNVIIRNNALQNAQVGAYGYGPAAPALDLNWVVTGNDCSNVGFAGIQLNNSQGASITNNNVSNVIPPATVVGRASGIVLSFSAVNATISGNKVNNVAQPTVGYGAEGMYFDIYNTSSGNNIFNNFISNATAPGSATIPFNGHGIFMDVGSGVNFYHNTINQNVNSSGASTTAAICFVPFAGAPGPVGPIPAGAVNIRDNIFVNSQTAGNRYGIYSVSPNTIFATIDYNDYVAPTGLGFIGGTNRTTIAQVQAGFGSNVNSINVAPTFVTTTDLHLQTVVANVPLMAGTPILAPAITTDIDGATRSTTTPTIGAHEILNKITYTPLTATCSDAIVTLTPVLIESVIGIPLAGAQIPRIYYRKGAGPWFSAAGTLLSGTAFNSNWSFSIDQSIVGGVTSGDIISYYVIAQTTGGAVFANPATGMVAVDVNTVTTPPTTPNTYTVNAITVSGLVTSQNLCYSAASAQIAPYAYTGTTGAPTQYALTWAPVGGPANVAAYAALPATPINVNVPAAAAAGSYTATLTVRNPTTTCTRDYTIYMTINSTPGALTGGNTVCVGSTITLASATTGGTFISTTPANATVNLTSGVVTGVALGTTTIVYTIGAGCVTSTTVNVIAPPAPITGTLSACPGSTSTLSSATPGGTWSTYNPVIASVGAGTGVVSAISSDTTTVYYKVVGCPAVKQIFTVNPVPAPITGYLYACVNFTTALSCATPGGTWSSGAPTIATVNASTGVVDGISNGSAPITYQLTSTGCYITNTVVIYPAAGPISGGPTICEGLSVSMTNPVAGGTWSSTAAGIVSIDISTGLATANAPTGTAIISYILGAGGCYATKVVTVSTAPTAITGTSVFCSGFYMPFSNGTSGGVWSSSNPAVASVSATGVVHGLAGGTTTISYNTPQCNAAAFAVTINQNPPPITGGITVCDGSSTTTLSNASPGGVWSLSGSSATISPSGVVTGLTLGSANVATYTMPNACFSVAAIVVDTLPGVITGPDSVCQSRTVTLNTSSTGGFWSSANSAIASINALTGNVTGVLYGATTISYAAVSGCTRTKPFIVSHPLLASVTVTRTPGDDTLCAGTPITFTAHHVNGGSNPAYQWQIFGVNTGTNDTNFTYTPTHGDVVSCYMTNSLDICALPSPAYVNIPVNIYPNVNPIVTITTTSASTVTHLGQVVTFYAEVTTAGGEPSYQWIVDGETIPGATSNVYVREVYDNDTVYCRVNGTPPCPTGSLATSNAIIIFGDWLGLGTVGAAENSLSLFPNPNAGTFTLTGSLGSTANETVRIDVVNVLGQVVFTGSTVTNSGAINYKVVLPAGISAGTYMLRANGETGNKVFHFTIGE